MQNLSKTGALIVAAGESRRMQGLDKILASLGGRPLLAWSVEAFQQSPLIETIVIVVSEKNIEVVRRLTEAGMWTKVAAVCLGGKRRQDSVSRGLKHLDGCEWVIVHDGARPFLTPDLIRQGLESAGTTGVAVAAVPVIDTIKLVDEHMIVKNTPPRHRLWAAQTPQIFRRDILEKAYRNHQEDVTDDASLVELLGYQVKLFKGSDYNIKITTPRDLALAEVLLKHYEP